MLRVLGLRIRVIDKRFDSNPFRVKRNVPVFYCKQRFINVIFNIILLAQTQLTSGCMVGRNEFYVPRYNYVLNRNMGKPVFKEIFLLLRHEQHFKVSVTDISNKYFVKLKVSYFVFSFFIHYLSLFFIY